MNHLKDVSNWDVEIKGDSSPLTRADKEANAVICEALMELAPHIPIVSEENRQVVSAVCFFSFLIHSIEPQRLQYDAMKEL